VPASQFESPAVAFSSTELGRAPGRARSDRDCRSDELPRRRERRPGGLAKIATAGNRRVDGHAPGLTGCQLDAYLAAGVESDHECTEVEEAEEKRRKGMWVFIREGSASRDLAGVIGTVLRHGTDRVGAVHRRPGTGHLAAPSGHVNDCARLAVAAGVRAEDALVMVTSNPADYYRFEHLGWLAPGYQADVLCFDDLSGFEPARVWQAGKLVAVSGSVLPGAVPKVGAPDWIAARRSTWSTPPRTERLRPSSRRQEVAPG